MRSNFEFLCSEWPSLREATKAESLANPDPRASVAARRHLFNREAVLPPRPDGWTPEEDRLLGKFNDYEVSRKLGRPLGGVRGRRYKLGLKSPRSTRLFTPEEDKLLGTDYDRVIGALLNRHPVTIMQRRHGLKILAFSKRTERD